MNTIHQNYDYIPVKASIILQLHRDLYKFTGNEGGHFKSADNVIAQIDEKRNSTVRFQPVPAWETSEYMDRICEAFQKACSDSQYDPLLLIPMFVLDFLCIHPFHDGNGRMSRLLTPASAVPGRYIVGMYISIEKLIKQTKETYYEPYRKVL